MSQTDQQVRKLNLKLKVMNLLEKIQNIAAAIPAEISEKKGIHTLEFIIAERKAFLTKKKLIYRARFKIDDEKKELRFTEMLKESGMGISSGMGDSEMSPGFGFKSSTYSIGMSGEREGTIEEQSNLFGKKYNYKFDFAKIRKDFDNAAKETDYKFVYKITSLGL